MGQHVGVLASTHSGNSWLMASVAKVINWRGICMFVFIEEVEKEMGR